MSKEKTTIICFLFDIKQKIEKQYSINDWSNEELGDILSEFCDFYGLPFICADELRVGIRLKTLPLKDEFEQDREFIIFWLELFNKFWDRHCEK